MAEKSREALANALALAERHGSAREAARASGVPESTFRGWVALARRMGLRASAAISDPVVEQSYIPPDVLEEDEDLEALIDRLEAEDDKRERARASLEWMEFKVNGSEPFALVFVGDPHADTCAIKTLREHLGIIETTDRMWAVGLGDWINQWAPKLRGQYAFQTVTEKQAFKLVEWMFNKPIWWAILLGNHNGGRWHGDGSPLKWMANACPTPVQEWQIKFTVTCGGASWKIWAAHNFPGNSIYNVNHGPDRRAIFTGAIADLFVAGDRHTFKLSHDQHEHTGRIFWTARAKGYKRLDLYAEELGFSGKQSIGHSIGAVFDPGTGRLTCFSDVKETADYLNFLRSR